MNESFAERIREAQETIEALRKVHSQTTRRKRKSRSSSSCTRPMSASTDAPRTRSVQRSEPHACARTRAAARDRSPYALVPRSPNSCATGSTSCSGGSGSTARTSNLLDFNSETVDPTTGFAHVTYPDDNTVD
jgi:hypothetical protein